MALPVAGRWIKWTIGKENLEFKAEVLGHEDIEDSEFSPFTGFRSTLEKHVNIRFVDGTEDSLGPEDCQRHKWSYCDAPSNQEVDEQKNKSLNQAMGGLLGVGRSCTNCECVTKQLLQCVGCPAFYCNASCQREDWSRHKVECKQEKIRRKPDPRYPLQQVDGEVGTCLNLGLNMMYMCFMLASPR